MINKYILLVLGLFFSCVLYATETNLDTLKISDKPNTVRVLSDNFKEKYTDDAYNYIVKEPSFFTVVKNWILNKLMEWLNTSVENAEDIYEKLKLGLYIIVIIGVIYYVVRIVLKKEGRWFFKKKTNSDEILYTNIEENISGVNFNTLIKEANEEENYRLAIRYYYLWLLKELDETDNIAYDPQKTNVDYQLELATSTLSEDFAKASYYYSYIWYGEFAINEEDYTTAILVYNNLLKQIKK